jgi:hypothetical protein
MLGLPAAFDSREPLPDSGADLQVGEICVRAWEAATASTILTPLSRSPS